MIPVSLRLSNFLSYGEDVNELDFTAFDVACVCGKNGHGKSALFDAVTWSLWGEARKAGSERKADAGLVRSGAREMRVAFVFDLHAHRYRVIRSFRKRPSGGVAGLELQIFDSATTRYHSLSESGSVRQTQQRIHALLGMSYETFVNSALLLQGQADAFTRRSPGDRKAVLAEILELNRYDDLSEAAREHLASARAAAAQGARRLAEIDETSARLETLKCQCQDQELRFKEATRAWEEADRRLNEAKTRAADVERLRRELSETRAERQRLSKEIKEVRNQLGAARHRRHAASILLADAAAIRERSARRSLLEARVADFAQRHIETTTALAQKTELEAKVAGARQRASHELELCRRQQALAAEELARVEATLATLSEVADLVRALEDLKAEDRRLNEARNKEHRLRAELSEATTLFERECAKRKARIASLAEEIERHRQTATALSELDDRVEQLNRQKDEVRTLERAQEKLRHESLVLSKEEASWAARLSDSETVMSRIDRQLDDLGQSDGDCPVCGTLLDEGHRKNAIERLEQDRSECCQERDRGRLAVAHAQVRQRTLADAIAQNEQSVARAARVEADLAQAQIERNQAMVAQEELANAESEHRRGRTNLQRFVKASRRARRCEQHRSSIAALDYDASVHDDVRRRIEAVGYAETDLRNIELARAEQPRLASLLEEAQDRTHEAESLLNGETVDPVIRKQLEEANERIARLDYDEQRHRKAHEELQATSDVPDALERLRGAERDAETAEAQIGALEHQLESLRPLLSVCERQMGALESALGASTDSESNIQTLQDGVFEARDTRDRLLQGVATLRRDCEMGQETIDRRPHVKSELERAEKDVVLYGHLIAAFGRDGIPALIIEQAIPEIEAEANALLARLTGDGTRVILDPVRNLRGGGTRETFDIRISDDVGERPYELYSGGEAFRVDFALRIALSRLLARRTGAPLQTLVIDEGFGTQDTEGVDRLVDAIQTVREDFAKILIISHVDAVKDAFPVTIAVTKTPDRGSSFQVLS